MADQGKEAVKKAKSVLLPIPADLYEQLSDLRFRMRFPTMRDLLLHALRDFVAKNAA